MRYEVSWEIFGYDEEIDEKIPYINTQQFNSLDVAMTVYKEVQADNNVNNAKISVILDEFSR